jgi:hypothetical protein
MSYKTSKLQRQRKPKSASLIDTIKQNYMDYRKFITKKMPKILRAMLVHPQLLQASDLEWAF